MFWGPSPSSAQPRRAQPSPAQPSPAQELNQAQPKPWCGPCQSSAKGFFLLDSDVAFSAHRRHRFWSAFGSFGTAVPLRFAVLKPRLWGLVFGASSAQLRPAQAVVWALPKLCQWLFLDSDVAFSAPRRHRFWCVFGLFGAAVPLRFAVLEPRLWGLVLVPSPSSSQPSPAQASPSLSVGLAKALPKAFS